MSVTFADGEIPGKKYGRTVELTKAATTLLGRLAAQHPSGALFRNSFGNPWTPSAIISRFRWVRTKVSFVVHAYVARHSWATDLIEAGASHGVVSALAGHRDPTVVLRVYGKHIEKRTAIYAACWRSPASESRERVQTNRIVR